MKEPGDYSRRMFDQPTDPVLSQIKFALRILQSQGFKGQSIAFLLTLESILEAGSREESVRTKLLRVLEPEKDEINRGGAHMKEIDITMGPDTGSYRIVERHTNDSVATTAQGMLEIAVWVELHRDRLRKEAGQELTHYQVELRKSNVMPRDKVVHIPVEAENAQEAASRALLRYGSRQMMWVTVTSAAKIERFRNVQLQQDRSITFEEYQEDLRPQPPFAPPFEPDIPHRIDE